MLRTCSHTHQLRSLANILTVCALTVLWGFGCTRPADVANVESSQTSSAGRGAATQKATNEQDEQDEQDGQDEQDEEAAAPARKSTAASKDQAADKEPVATADAGAAARMGESNAGSSQQQTGAAGSSASNQALAGAMSATPTSGAGAGQAGAAARPPANSVAACMDKMPGEFACDGTTLYHCADMGTYELKQSCATAARCQAGLKSGKCGTCDPGQGRCTGFTPEKCDEMGVWQRGEECASQALCNEMTGECDRSGCEAGEYRCNGDSLEVCNRDLTGFETEEMCPAGLCNKDKKRCNECEPETQKCENQTVLSMCSADGEKQPDACGGETPYCLEDKCVECASNADCAPVAECQNAVCNHGTCEAGDPKPLKTSCDLGFGASGVCDLLGNCMACLDDSDCHDPRKRCNLLNVLSPCEDRSPLEVTPSLLGGYTVTVAPGYSVDVATPPGLILVNLGLVPCLGGCTLPSASDARTYTFSGPACTGGLEKLLPQTQTTVATLSFGPADAAEDGSSSCQPNVTLTARSAR